MTLLARVEAVRALHAEIDARTSEFARQAGLSCPPGCGRCCENPDIRVTVLDCLPLAMSWMEAGLTHEWHERLLALESEPGSFCPFYRSSDSAPAGAGLGRGRCTQYEQRMSLCRLFGYASVQGKSGQARVAHCGEHKSSWTPPADLSAEQLGRLAPLFSDYSMRLASIEPSLGRALLPAATAARLALEHLLLRSAERVGLAFQKEQGETPGLVLQGG